MATSNSLAAISRRFYRTLISVSSPKPYCNHQRILKSSFSTESSSAPEHDSDPPNSESADSELPSPTESSSSPGPTRRRVVPDPVLEGGLDVGVYKAILVGQVGQNPLQKRLKNGSMLTMLTLGTGGIRNERIPFPNEEPREYAERCNVQWHRVAVYPGRLGQVVMKNCQPGTIVYVEGNLETKLYTDAVTGLTRRIREVAIRGDGRIVFLGNGGEFNQPSFNELKGVGYY